MVNAVNIQAPGINKNVWK